MTSLKQKSQNETPQSRTRKLELLLLLDEKEKRNCERSYYEFFKRAWKVLEPETPFKSNWHIEYLCKLLQAEIERVAARLPKNKDLIINIPPRSAKSYIVSIILCPWAWTRFPHLKFINSSYSRDLSIDHNLKGRRLIESNWYQKNWGKVFSLTGDQNVKSHYENDKKGSRFATSVSGGVTGHGADIIFCDDLLDPKKAKSDAYRKTSNDHYDSTLFSRLNDQNIGLRVVVMQRLHEEDTTGHVLSKNPDKYRHICIPAEIDENNERSLSSVQPSELREFYQDGLFFPGRFTRSFLDQALKGLRAVEYAGQYLQKPSPPEGNIFKREWWKFFSEIPDKFDKQIQSWDMSFKGKQDSDFVVGLVMAKVGSRILILNRIRRRMGFTKTLEAFVSLSQMYPQTREKLIEDKANGPGIVDVVKNKIDGVIEVPPIGSKTERAEAVSWLVEAGNVELPDPHKHSWVNEFIEELAAFPNGSNDDQVDAFSQGAYRLSGNSVRDRLKTLLLM